VKCILFLTNYNGMSGVIAALITNNIFDLIAKEISCFPLALIAPLSTKQNYGRHDSPTSRITANSTITRGQGEIVNLAKRYSPLLEMQDRKELADNEGE